MAVPDILPSGRVPSAEQQKVIDRILVQRERLRARRAAQRQVVQVRQAQQPAQPELDPAASMAVRLLAFSRQHPVFVGVLVAAAVAAGPARLIRWSAMVMPLWNSLRR